MGAQTMTAYTLRVRAGASFAGEDERLIAEAHVPPDLDDARESLAFWARRLARARVFQRSRRREASQMVDVWRARVRAAERLRRGPTVPQLLADLLGIRRFPVRRLVGAAKKALLVTGIVLSVTFMMILATTILVCVELLRLLAS